MRTLNVKRSVDAIAKKLELFLIFQNFVISKLAHDLKSRFSIVERVSHHSRVNLSPIVEGRRYSFSLRGSADARQKSTVALGTAIAIAPRERTVHARGRREIGDPTNTFWKPGPRAAMQGAFLSSSTVTRVPALSIIESLRYAEITRLKLCVNPSYSTGVCIRSIISA